MPNMYGVDIKWPKDGRLYLVQLNDNSDPKLAMCHKNRFAYWDNSEHEDGQYNNLLIEDESILWWVPFWAVRDIIYGNRKFLSELESDEYDELQKRVMFARITKS